MKNDYTLLSRWFAALMASNIISAFCSGIPRLIFQFTFPANHILSDISVYIFTTAIVCISLSLVSYRTGLQMNSTTRRVSIGTPVFNLLSGAALYILLFSIIGRFILPGFKIGYVIALPSQTLSKLQCGSQGEASIGEQIGSCILQTLIYFSISLLFYLLAKRRQDTQNRALKKLREETDKSD